MELRALTQCAVDLVSQVGRSQRVDIGLGGHREDCVRVRDRTQDGLAADDDELVLIRHRSAGADQMFEFLTGHGSVRLGYGTQHDALLQLADVGQDALAHLGRQHGDER